ncbi:CaiB/BaiF CoA transferase family protein [Reinekea blandensis]|uniref:Alpha-methylacyl-CoA racemase, putative n=1 Tax=Reinekea blandensis MED297 TaxID=314283 RepID=A4BGI5_9GAMM|nr:CaiB/BaiF CoA-transferase family protein [Reinekea blandensis]EAR08791.1 alpha-methylacyl-CoA racemase, putative [Reinekea sp. MED297] [Reinekea blandensis MED297]
MKPLTGYTLLDFSPLLPGPWASEQLRQLGMRVIRIESPRHPDLLRTYPNAFRDINADKETWVLDLKAPGAVDEVKARLPDIDVILEAFRPGVMSRLGLGYDQLIADFPELVYCSLTGYGQSGPLANTAGHDLNFQALAGLLSYQGGTEPVPTSVQVADIAGGSYPAMVGILSALLARERTGQGQYIDISMADGALALNAMAASETLGGQAPPQARAGVLNGGGFYGCYRCRDGRYLAFGGLEPKFFSVLCEGLERPDWVSRFADFSPATQQALREDLQALFVTRDRADWLRRLPEDCCLSPVLDLRQALSHPQFVARGAITDSGKVSVPVQFRERPSS